MAVYSTNEANKAGLKQSIFLDVHGVIAASNTLSWANVCWPSVCRSIDVEPLCYLKFEDTNMFKVGRVHSKSFKLQSH